MKHPHMGTWELNEGKSKFTPGTVKFTTIAYKSVFENVKVTTHGIEANDKTAHSEWSGKFDGKDYPVTGNANQDTRSYTEENDQTLVFTAKKNGKITTAGRIVLSADGKTRTSTVTGTTPEGKTFTHIEVHEKQ